MQSWQTDWDEFNQRAAGPRQETEVQQSRIQHLEHSLARLKRRLEELSQEREAQGSDSGLDRLEGLRAGHGAADGEVQRLGAEREELERLRGRQAPGARRAGKKPVTPRARSCRPWPGAGRLSRLCRQAARERTEGADLAAWLEDQGLAGQARVIDGLDVEERWQRTVEVVLGSTHQGLITDGIDGHAAALGALSRGDITLFEGAGEAPAGDSLAARVAADGVGRVRAAAPRACALH